MIKSYKRMIVERVNHITPIPPRENYKKKRLSMDLVRFAHDPRPAHGAREQCRIEACACPAPRHENGGNNDTGSHISVDCVRRLRSVALAAQ